VRQLGAIGFGQISQKIANRLVIQFADDFWPVGKIKGHRYTNNRIIQYTNKWATIA
jgi:hypothetical protein